MKKALIALSMGLLMAGMLVACSGSDDITVVPEDPENPQNGGGKDPQKTGDDEEKDGLDRAWKQKVFCICFSIKAVFLRKITSGIS